MVRDFGGGRVERCVRDAGHSRAANVEERAHEYVMPRSRPAVSGGELALLGTAIMDALFWGTSAPFTTIAVCVLDPGRAPSFLRARAELRRQRAAPRDVLRGDDGGREEAEPDAADQDESAEPGALHLDGRRGR